MIRILEPIETYSWYGDKALPVTLVRAACDACECAAQYNCNTYTYNASARMRQWAELFATNALERTCWALDKFDPRTLRGHSPLDPY